MTNTNIARMGRLRSRSKCKQERRREEAILPSSSAQMDMLAWWKGLALDPCNRHASKDSFRKIRNQSLKVRKLIRSCNVECPPRKRRFEQFIGGTKLTTASTLAPEESDNQNVKNLGNTQISSVSSLLNSGDKTESHKRQVVFNSHSSCSTLTFEDSFKEKRVNTDITSLDGTKCSSVSKDYPLNDGPRFIQKKKDCLRFVNGPSRPSSTTQDAPQSNFIDLVHSSDSSSSEEPNPKFQRALGIIDSFQNPVAVADFIDSAMRMISRGDHFCRPVIPIGPKFQAEIPEWTCLEKRKNLYGDDDDSENLKWLGTRIWPMEGRNTETTVKAVGKGRHDACYCVSPGSADCVKRHVLKERLCLQSDIGAAFRCWKFDEMGEEAVSKSWTLEEQSRFESLVKVNPPCKEANFWELALKCFPSKSKISILSYYFNVFIPRRMSLRSKSSLETFDSSDSSSLEEPNPKFQRALGIIDSIQNPVAVADFIDSAMRMISSGDHFCRPVIPIGPKFQAEIPEWTCLEKRKNLYGGDDDSENLKWLGTRIWPMEGRNTETTVKAVGKGRHDACSCVSPGSADCVKRHVLKERLRLQSDIGAAFRCWKFDDMGEEAVSKSWTLEEQSRFESLVKVNPLWKVANFWELALKRFPSKSMKSILSYYFNVFIPRRMSLQSKSSLETFDSDDDQADDEVPVEE